MTDTSGTEGPAQSRSEKYRHLPEHIELRETVATKESEPPPDPQMGRDTEQEFLLRNAGFS